MKFQVGDKVEVVEVLAADDKYNVKLRDVAKVVEVQAGWYICANPNWGGGNMPMKKYQIKKL